MPDDEDPVTFEVGRSDDLTEWRLNVKCPSGLKEDEFDAALQALAEDILKGEVSFETAEDVPAKAIDPDLH